MKHAARLKLGAIALFIAALNDAPAPGTAPQERTRVTPTQFGASVDLPIQIRARVAKKAYRQLEPIVIHVTVEVVGDKGMVVTTSRSKYGLYQLAITKDGADVPKTAFLNDILQFNTFSRDDTWPQGDEQKATLIANLPYDMSASGHYIIKVGLYHGGIRPIAVVDGRVVGKKNPASWSEAIEVEVLPRVVGEEDLTRGQEKQPALSTAGRSD